MRNAVVRVTSEPISIERQQQRCVHGAQILHTRTSVQHT